jgi:hypothetical protein
MFDVAACDHLGWGGAYGFDSRVGEDGHDGNSTDRVWRTPLVITSGAALYRKAREAGAGRELPAEWFTEDVFP